MISKRNLILGGLGLGLGCGLGALTENAARAQARTQLNHVLSVPIEVSPVGRLYVSVMIGGRGPFRFVIDTGAYVSCIRESLAKELGLAYASSSIGEGMGGGEMNNAVYLARDMVFGGALRQSAVALSGLKAFPECDGLLAAGFLTVLPTELDYEAREIRFYPPHTLDESAYHWLPTSRKADSEQSSPKVYIRMKWRGDTLQAVLDTGAPPELILLPDYVRAHHLWDSFPSYKALTGSGITGAAFTRRLVDAQDINLGAIHYDTLKISLEDPSVRENVGGEDAILGSRLLRQFTIAFNGEKGVGLKPNSAFTGSATG
jgi:hypothetical protein